MTEEEAQMFCGIYGGHVVEVDSEEENTVIQEIRAGKYIHKGQFSLNIFRGQQNLRLLQ